MERSQVNSLYQEKIKRAILRIQDAYKIAQSFNNALICAYSGGKDSDVLLDLCIKSGVDFEAVHNHTTVDAPETIYHIREVFKNLSDLGVPNKINYPKMSMWELIPNKLMPPTRTVRYCCEILKERKFKNQHILTGVRWDESNSRKNRGVHESLHVKKDKRIVYFDENDDHQKLTNICMSKNRIATNPMIDWLDREVWEYVKSNNIKMNPLYDKGYKRVGCIGCPMGGKSMYKEFAEYPVYRTNYIKAFDRMLEERSLRGLVTDKWECGEDVMKWWLKEDANQISMFED